MKLVLPQSSVFLAYFKQKSSWRLLLFAAIAATLFVFLIQLIPFLLNSFCVKTSLSELIF
jgi:hypothetical protein